MTAEFIVICALLFATVIMCGTLAILVYNQCLLFNEVNKRLLYLVTEANNYARDSYEDVIARMEALQFEQPERRAPVVDEPEEAFDPHGFILKDEDGIS